MKITSRSSLLPLALLLLAAAPLAASPTEGSAVQPARPVTTAEPVYPYLQPRAEAAAQVTVAFTVDPQGKVAGAKIASSSNYEFNNAPLF